MKTKSIRLLLPVLLSLLLSACGKSSSAVSQTMAAASDATPKQTVETALDALKRADTNVYNSLIQYVEEKDGAVVYKDNKIFGDKLDQEEKEFVTSIFEDFSYKIGDVKENGDTATVPIQITNRDLSNVWKDILRYRDADNPMTEAVKNSDHKLVTVNTEITLKKTNGAWMVQMNHTLINSLCGGFVPDFSKMLSFLK